MRKENESLEDYKLRIKLEKMRFRNLIKTLDNLFDLGDDEEMDEVPNTSTKKNNI